MAKIEANKHQINECGLTFLVEECHIDETWLRECFEVLKAEAKDSDLRARWEAAKVRAKEAESM